MKAILLLEEGNGGGLELPDGLVLFGRLLPIGVDRLDEVSARHLDHLKIGIVVEGGATHEESRLSWRFPFA